MSVVCKTCHDPIVRVGETRSGLAVWEHDGPEGDHEVEPKSLCPKCDSFNYAFYQTNWGHGWRCADCGHDQYYSIGD